MPEAFVCINASPDSVDEVFTELKSCKEVKEAFRVYGEYNIIARVSGESMEELSNVIITRIRRLSEVESTLSMIMVKPDEHTRKSELLTV